MTATSKAASLIGVAMAALSLALAPVDANAARRRDVATPATTPRPAAALPPAVASILRASGLPASSFAVSVRSVETPDVPPLLAFNAEQPFLLASTTKLVTSLAALDLLGPDHRWRTTAYATGTVAAGRLAGDLVISGGPVGLTGNELRRWFAQMRADGVRTITGNIVLEAVALLHERDPKQARATGEERDAELPPDARTYNKGKLLVSVSPTRGERAAVTLRPRPSNVLVVGDVFMGGTACSAWARWKTADEIESGPPLQLWVRGRWSADCGSEDIAFVSPPAEPLVFEPELGAAPALPIAATRMVADLWAEAGGRLAGHVVERTEVAPRPRVPRWSSELETPVAEVLREMNKTSNNEAARSVLLSLAPADAPRPRRTIGGLLQAAQQRMRGWLRGQGLRDGDITVVLGSGESRGERGKPRALVELLRSAWRSANSQSLVDSLPIAGVDGTLVNRMTHGPATGKAFLKTGTLFDTRALAGYVRARSGKIYAVSMIVTDAEAAKGRPALDAIVEWLARAG